MTTPGGYTCSTRCVMLTGRCMERMILRVLAGGIVIRCAATYRSCRRTDRTNQMTLEEGSSRTRCPGAGGFAQELAVARNRWFHQTNSKRSSNGRKTWRMPGCKGSKYKNCNVRHAELKVGTEYGAVNAHAALEIWSTGLRGLSNPIFQCSSCSKRLWRSCVPPVNLNFSGNKVH